MVITWSHSLVKIRKQFNSSRTIPPISHEINYNSERRKNVYTSSSHSIIRIAGCTFTQSTRCICVGVNRISFFDEWKSAKGGAHLDLNYEQLVVESRGCYAYVCSNACYYDLLLSSCFDGFSEFFVVPCIHLSVSFNVRSVRMQFDNLSRKWPIGT